jgi:hypothetical protein
MLNSDIFEFIEARCEKCQKRTLRWCTELCAFLSVRVWRERK